MRTGTRRIASTAGLVALGLTAVLAMACDTVPLTAPGSSTVTITTAASADGQSTAVTATVRANPGSVPATGGTAEIVARVTATGGNGFGGVPVTFSSTAGTLSGTREVTDGNGEAKVRLTTDANATVTATAGTKSGTVTIQ